MSLFKGVTTLSQFIMFTNSIRYDDINIKIPIVELNNQIRETFVNNRLEI